MPTICVPDAATATALADLVTADSGLTLLTWRPGQPAPAGVEAVEFLVATYGARALTPDELALMPKLKVLQLQSAGVEHWLGRVPDGVTFCNGRGIHGSSTAELALAAILSHLRALPAYAESQRQGEWRPRRATGLRHRRVVVLGAGDIGRRVADAAQVFEAEVAVVARRPREGISGLADLPNLLPGAEIVVVALPDTAETQGLVDAGFLAAMPDGALLVNVARGSLVVTDALIAELESGRLSAFLDVVETEPLPSGHPLWSTPNLVLTPHVGGGTGGWHRAANELIHGQIERYLRGEPLINQVREGY